MFYLNYFSQIIKEVVGLTIIRIKGNRWRKASRCSRVKEVEIFDKKGFGAPCCES